MCLYFVCFCFFVFKQKTAYEMRISDWSSDVCSSDLMAFNSVERIMRDVNYGWLIRYIHMNGASFFFIVVYIHIFRGLYYGSYKQPRELLWILGVVILLLMMATAFMGYVLPWGQMSFWGATKSEEHTLNSSH